MAKTSDVFTPGEIGTIDQNNAALDADLNTLIEGYRILAKRNSPTVAQLCLTNNIDENFDVDRLDLTRLLARAVQKLAGHDG